MPVVGAALAEARLRCAARPDRSRLRHETIRRVIDALTTDLVLESRRRLSSLAAVDADAIRGSDRPVIGFGSAMAADNAEIRAFLHTRLYRHWRVNRMSEKARQVTASLFSVLSGNLALLPDGWRDPPEPGDPAHAVRGVADYIAGMTDRFAIEEHRRLTDPSIPG